MNKKILYVEFGTSHTEILYSFLKLLTPENQVHLLINEKSKSRIQFELPEVKISFSDENKLIDQFFKMKKSIQPDLIIFNSAQGKLIRNLCLRLMFDKTPIIGIHHNPENIVASFTQKLIHFKIKKYIVLADFIQRYLISQNVKSKIASIYAVYYPPFEPAALGLNDQYISIPGVLEQDRRDYLGLVDLVERFDKHLPANIKFVLLGSCKTHDGELIYKKIVDKRIEDRFVLFDKYVDDRVLLSYIKNSLAIMPLLHPGTRWFDKYFETKISGAYSLAFGFKKKLLMHQVFSEKEEFKAQGVFYTQQHFGEELLYHLFATSLDTENQNFVTDLKFEFSFQKKKLFKFIDE